MTRLALERAYSESTDAAFRVYVDRLWPRGLSHENFHYDLWAKNISPSDELRKWFHEDPSARWEEFRKRYEAELAANPEWSGFVNTLGSHPEVILIYSSHDEKENNALVVAEMLTTSYPDKFSL